MFGHLIIDPDRAIMIVSYLEFRSIRLPSRLSPFHQSTVITGFNTDIEYEGVTYHVQTEDKGLSKPVIMSLVYDRGTILASKRLPYDDLLAEGFDENVLAERLQKQHRLICAAVKAGRIEDLKRMTAKESAASGKPSVAVVETATDRSAAEAEDHAAFPGEISDPSLPIPRPAFAAEQASPAEELSYLPIVEAIGIIDEAMIPSEAVEIISDLFGKERPGNNKLSIEFLGETKLKGGERKTVEFMVCRGSQRKVVSDAEIMVKILGSSFRTLIFHSLTDKNGIARINLHLPSFRTGRAAFLARAISDGEEIELRRTIAHV